MFKEILLILIVAFGLSAVSVVKAEPVQIEECIGVKNAATFFVDFKDVITQDKMRQLFPRHLYIIKRIYDSESGYGEVMNLYNECLNGASI